MESGAQKRGVVAIVRDIGEFSRSFSFILPLSSSYLRVRSVSFSSSISYSSSSLLIHQEVFPISIPVLEPLSLEAFSSPLLIPFLWTRHSIQCNLLHSLCLSQAGAGRKGWWNRRHSSFTRGRHCRSDLPSFLSLLVASSWIAGFAAGIDTPADVIKTRLQNGKEDYKGIRDCFTRITTEEGYSALFKGALRISLFRSTSSVAGVQVRMIVIAPLFAITFTTYELLKRLWRPHSESPIDLLEEHSEAMRRSRLKKVAKELKREFGLEMRISE